MFINILLLLVAFAASSCAIEISPKREECGGTFTSDYEVFSYPAGSESLYPGEVCVWTVHLSTEMDIGFTFSKFDFHSISPNFDCSDSGIRIYPLANEKDLVQNYTFCSDNPPPGNLIIPGNAATIVMYSLNNVLSKGFELLFYGYNKDDTNTTHLSTYSRTPSGLIGYPVGGAYPPSVVATWTIDATSVNSTPPYLDINLQSVGLETCPNTDPCTCDTLIVYEISDKGLMSMRERYCSSTTNNVLSNAPGRFIVAFFSDATTQSGSGDGFQLQYLSAADPPVTPEPDTNIPCGTIIYNTETELSFKETVQYSPNERCVWILQTMRASNYRVQIFSYGITNPNDGLTLTGIQRVGNPTPGSNEEVQITGEGVYEVRGDIAILTFHSGSSSGGFGFRAKVSGLFYNDRNPLYSANYIFNNPNPFKLTYPSYGNYSANELSLFVYAPNSEGNTGTIRRAVIQPTWTDYCDDNLVPYLFSQDIAGGSWIMDQRICGGTAPAPNATTILSRDIMLFRFYSDSGVQRGGFTISFS